MVEGTVPTETWLWADLHKPDGGRARIWRGSLETPDADGASVASAPPRSPRRAAGARRAADCRSSPSSGRTRPETRAPPPPPDGAGHRSPADSRAARSPPRARRRSGARSRPAAAASGSGSPGPSSSSYTASASPTRGRTAVQAPPDSVHSLGSRGSGSTRRSGRGIYASGRAHSRLPAPNRRAPRTPSHRRLRPDSPGGRSRSRPPCNRAVVLAGPPRADERSGEPERFWAPSVPGRTAPGDESAGRPRVSGRPKPSGAPHRIRTTSRGTRREHRGRRRARDG